MAKLLNIPFVRFFSIGYVMAWSLGLTAYFAFAGAYLGLRGICGELFTEFFGWLVDARLVAAAVLLLMSMVWLYRSASQEWKESCKKALLIMFRGYRYTYKNNNKKKR